MTAGETTSGHAATGAGLDGGPPPAAGIGIAESRTVARSPFSDRHVAFQPRDCTRVCRPVPLLPRRAGAFSVGEFALGLSAAGTLRSQRVPNSVVPRDR